MAFRYYKMSCFLPVEGVMIEDAYTVRYPRTILRSTPQKIDFGRVSEASLSSSATIGQYGFVTNKIFFEQFSHI